MDREREIHRERVGLHLNETQVLGKSLKGQQKETRIIAFLDSKLYSELSWYLTGVSHQSWYLFTQHNLLFKKAVSTNILFVHIFSLLLHQL